MNAYLQPLVDAYGEHKGLNADWCTMAWLVSTDAVEITVSSLWIVDNEEPDESVAVMLCTFDEEGDRIDACLFTGSVAEALLFVKGRAAAMAATAKPAQFSAAELFANWKHDA